MDKSMTSAAKTPGIPARQGTHGPAQQPDAANRQRRMIVGGIELSMVARFLGSKRFHAFVIVGAIGVAALASLVRENLEGNSARLVAWNQRQNLRNLRRAKGLQRRANDRSCPDVLTEKSRRPSRPHQLVGRR
jgi:hypothetical protein